MKATILNIGDEILIGQILNTNAMWMAQILNQQGISVNQIITVGDSQEAIIDGLKQALSRTKLVFITGGLGPTKDDITKKTLAHYFGMELEFHQPSFDNIKQLFAQLGRVADDRYLIQAQMPVGAKILINKTGTASGMWFERAENIVVSLPGFPKEVKYLMEYEVLPQLKLQLKTPTIMHRTINVTGKSETDLSEMLEDFEAKLPSNIKLAYLPKSLGLMRLRLSATGNDAIVLESQLDYQVGKLPLILGNLIFGEEKDSLESIVGKLLLLKGFSLGTAESCTGGNIARKITSVSGCSAYYDGSVISYSNESKIDLLGVRPETIDTYGAVSKECVIEMARGTQKLRQVDCSIAVSGVAGPLGGSPEKPVGTIWVAITKQKEIYTQKLQLGSDRIENIERTTTIALNLLRLFLLNDLEKTS